MITGIIVFFLCFLGIIGIYLWGRHIEAQEKIRNKMHLFKLSGNGRIRSKCS